MKHTPRHTSTGPIPMADVTRRRLATLLAEREAMQEEIRQLSAAVQVYTEIVRRMECSSTRRAA